MFFFFRTVRGRSGLDLDLLLARLGAFTEAVFEATWQVAHVGHAACSLCATTLSLVVMVEPAHLGRSAEAARSTTSLLDVVGRFPASPADDVGLVIAGATAADTFRHCGDV